MHVINRFSPAGHRPITGGDIYIVAVLLLTFFALAVYILWNKWAVDFASYYFAGYFYATGDFAQIYNAPPDVIAPEMQPAWQAATYANGAGGKQVYAYIYLPWVAAVMAPISTYASPQNAMNGMMLLDTGLLLLSAALAWRILPTRWPLGRWMAITALLIATSIPTLMALWFGQIQIIVFTACLLCIDRLQAGRSIQAALWLAFAAMLKITPAAFAIAFIWNRDWKGLATFTCATLGFAGFCILVIGWPLHAQYFALLDRLDSLILIANAAASAEGLLFQLVELVRGIPHTFIETENVFPKPIWQSLLIKFLFIIGLLIIWHRGRHAPRRERLAQQFFALAILVPLMSPLGWIHYFLPACFIMPLLLERPHRLERIMFLGYALSFNLFSFSMIIEDSAAGVAAGAGIIPGIVLPYFIYVPYMAGLFLLVTFRTKSLFITPLAAPPPLAKANTAH